MNTRNTGDQSGGIDPRDGSSTPAHRGHGDADNNDSNSAETAESTDDKNAPEVFRQNLRSTPDTNPKN